MKMDLQMRISIVELYYQNGCSPSATVRAYKKLHNIHNDPFSASTVNKLITKFKQTGSVNDAPRGGRPSFGDQTIENVSNVAEAEKAKHHDGICSLSQIAHASGVPKSSVRKILRVHLGMKRYKPTYVQELQEGDRVARVNFAHLYISTLQHNEDQILWTDEAHFHLSGEVSSINGYIWSVDNPHVQKSKPLHSPKITVWIGFTSKFVVTPFFFEQGETIRKENYLQMLKEHVVPFLKEHRKFSRTIFMQDGAPPHTANIVKDYLRHEFGDRLIGKFFDCPWPPRSPDLTPCDFFLWGLLKRKVYKHNITSLEHLKAIVLQELSRIPPEFFENVIQ